jgi:hypothetical protein
MWPRGHRLLGATRVDHGGVEGRFGAPRATAKATGGRVWVYSCVGQLQAVAVYRASEDASRAPSPLRPLRAERLESVNSMPTGSGSMDPQTPNVPLPFGRLVRCP